MTENEAIKHLQSYAEVVDNMIKYCKDFEPKADITGYLEKKTVFAMAISTLKEVQKYSEIGTVEECKELASIVNKVEKNELAKIIDEWISYRKIGTVEECREAVEKQKAKKCIIDSCPDHTHYKCPSCGKIHLSRYKHGFPSLGRIPRFCDHCGQAIDENLEEMEDERD